MSFIKRIMPPKTASPGLGGEISALLALPNAMTNDASLAATHSATSFGSLLLHPQCAAPQAEIHLKRLAMVFLLKLGCSARINLDFSNVMAALLCVGFGAFRQLQVWQQQSQTPDEKLRWNNYQVQAAESRSDEEMYQKRNLFFFYYARITDDLPSSSHLCPVQAQQRQHGASSPATIPTSGTFRRPYPPVEPSNFQRYLKYLAFEIFRFSKVCAGRKNKETYVPRAPGETVPSSSYIWVTWVTFPRRATVQMNRNSRIAIRRRAVRCCSSDAKTRGAGEEGSRAPSVKKKN